MGLKPSILKRHLRRLSGRTRYYFIIPMTPIGMEMQLELLQIYL